MRHPLPVAICALASAITAGVFIFARPEYRPAHQGTTIKIPDKQPAHDAAGRAGWLWPDAVPGWEPGYTIKGFNVSQLQPIEAQPAQLAAAHIGLTADQVRVLIAQHLIPGQGPLAIFAAPMADVTPRTVCLAAALPRAASVAWRCPGSSRPYPDLANSRLFVAAVAHAWLSQGKGRVSLNLVGVARGDVYRVVLHIPGQIKPAAMPDWTLYQRGKTWGQFEADLLLLRPAGTPELRVYGRNRLVQTVQLKLRPGEQQVIG